MCSGSFPAPRASTRLSTRRKSISTDGRCAALPRPRADDRFPRRLPNAPFRLEPFVDIDGHTMDPVHDFYLEQEQIDGGKMDRFVEASNAGALVMGYYDGSELKQWALAKEFTLADHFFHAAFGGSMLNHFFLICGCAPVFDNPVEATRKKFRAKARDDQGFAGRGAHGSRARGGFTAKRARRSAAA